MKKILDVIQKSNHDNIRQIETVLEYLNGVEDEAINQLLNGEISVDAYCNLLVGNR